MKTDRGLESGNAVGEILTDSPGSIHVINAIILSLGFIYVLASFSPGWWFWGADSMAVYPIWLRLLLFALLMLFSLPWLSEFIAQKLSPIVPSLSKTQAILIYCLISIIILTLFVLFSSKNHLLGDGYIIQSTLAEGKRFSATEPLEFFSHYLVYKLLGGNGIESARWSYALLSYFAGAAFLWALFRFARDGAVLLTTLAATLTFGTMQFFFGYVENYTLSFVLVFIYLLAGWRDYQAGRVSPITIIALALALGFHLNSAVFLPSLIALIWNRKRSKRQLIGLITAAVALVFLGALYLEKFTALNLREIFVPIMPISNNPYSLVSFSHLHDLINILLLDFPLLLAIPFLTRITKKGLGLFLWLAILSSSAFTVFIDPRIGAVRDWDLLSLPTAPILVALMAKFDDLRDSLRSYRYGLVIPLILLALMHTGSWIYLNTQRNQSYTWLKSIIQHDLHYSEYYFEGYRNKSWAIITKANFRDLAESIRACETRFHVVPNDAGNTVMLANNYMAAGDTSRAADLILQFPPESYDGENILAGAGLIMMVSGHFREAEIIYEKYVSEGYVHPAILYNIGICKELKGQRELAYSFYFKAYEVWSDAPLSQELSFYLACRKYGYNELFRQGIVRMISKLPSAPRQIAVNVLQAIDLGDRRAADSLTSYLAGMLGGP